MSRSLLKRALKAVGKASMLYKHKSSRRNFKRLVAAQRHAAYVAYKFKKGGSHA